jgi:pimeloyl-ACP methyl ester carboxylesterase
MRGYHPSAIANREPDQETWARDPLALIKALGAPDAIVIGHDWGASAAYGAAAFPIQRRSNRR